MALVRERHLSHPFLRFLKLLNSWNWTMTHILAISLIQPTFTRERKLNFGLASTWSLLSVMTIMVTIWNTFQIFNIQSTCNYTWVFICALINFIYTNADSNILVSRISIGSSWFAVGSMSHNWFLGDSWVLFSVPVELNIVWSRVFFQANSSLFRYLCFIYYKFPAEVSWFAVVFSLAFWTNVGQS
jgi:hypothetical protein